MLEAVTQALVAHIHEQTPELGEWVVIHSLSADEPDPGRGRLVICLLAVEELDHVVNAPPGEAVAGRRRQPLRLRLDYLFTYLGPHAEAMSRLTRLLDVFQASPVLGTTELPPALADTVERLTLRLRNTTPEERHDVWGALGRPARLGVFYTVDVMPRVKKIDWDA